MKLEFYIALTCILWVFAGTPLTMLFYYSTFGNPCGYRGFFREGQSNE